MSETTLPPLKNPVSLDVNRIMAAIPHRYPFLMLDRIISLTPMEEAVGQKAVTVSEPHFQGHFPVQPIMPGVLIVESMAQTAAVMVVESLGDQGKGKLVYFMGVDKAKFRRPVVPGDRLDLHVVKIQQRGAVWKFDGTAYVDGQKVAEAEFSAMIRDPE